MKSCGTFDVRNISFWSLRAIMPPSRATIPSSSVTKTCSVRSSISSRMRARFSSANPAAGATRASISFFPASTSAISLRRFSAFSGVSGLGVELSSTTPSSISGWRSQKASATYPPIECPTSVQRPMPRALSASATVSARKSIVWTAPVTTEMPWPGRSSVTTRTSLYR